MYPLLFNAFQCTEGTVPSVLKRCTKQSLPEEMSLRKAAEEYSVPRSTLHAKVQGKVAISVKSGAKIEAPHG